jgi:hypothetical protein
VHFQAWNLEILPSVGFDDKKGFKRGAGPLVFMMLHRDSLQGRREKVEDLDNDLAVMTHDEGEEGIDDINANGYGNDNDNDNDNAHTSGNGG